MSRELRRLPARPSLRTQSTPLPVVRQSTRTLPSRRSSSPKDIRFSKQARESPESNRVFLILSPSLPRPRRLPPFLGLSVDCFPCNRDLSGFRASHRATGASEQQPGRRHQ